MVSRLNSGLAVQSGAQSAGGRSRFLADLA
jgi:hypothetical protein